MTQVVTLQPGSGAARPDWTPTAQQPDRFGVMAHTPDPNSYHDVGGRTMLPRHTNFGGSKGFATRPGVVNVDPTDPVRGLGGLTVDLERVSKNSFIKASQYSGGNPLSAWALAAQSQQATTPSAAQVVQMIPGQPTLQQPIQQPLQQATVGVAQPQVMNMHEAMQAPVQYDAGGAYVQMAPGAGQQVTPGPYVVPHTTPSGGIIPRENVSTIVNPLARGGAGMMPQTGAAPMVNPHVRPKEASITMQVEPAPWDAVDVPAQTPVLQQPIPQQPMQHVLPQQVPVQLPVQMAPQPQAVPQQVPQQAPYPVQYQPMPPEQQHAPMPTQGVVYQQQVPIQPQEVPQKVTIQQQPVQQQPMQPQPVQQQPMQQLDPVQQMMLAAIKELGDQVKELGTRPDRDPPAPAAPGDWEMAKEALRASSPEDQLPEGTEYARTDECDAPYLTTPPSRPRVEVVFDLGVGGIHSKRFHHVAKHGKTVSLITDSRCECDQFIPPSTEKDEHTIGIEIPSQRFKARVKTFRDFHLRLGCQDILNFVIWESPSDMGPPIATHDTIQELHTLGGMADEFMEPSGQGTDWS